jgi:hypothetical protein
MKKLTIVTVTVGALGAAGLGLAATATAAPLSGSSASDTVNSLRSDGYDVQINGSAQVPLARCTTTGVHGLPSTAPVGGQRANSTTLTTVYVDISCPDNV